MSMQWLLENAPGFNNLSDDERNAIVDFSLLWTLFEARILDNNGSTNAICRVVATWREAGALQLRTYEQELAYFRDRYFANGDFTGHFIDLRLRPNDKIPLVRSVISGSNNDPCACVSATFIIIFRYRNNLFHGVKWRDELRGQRDNFLNANTALMKALERHGQLADG